jgi:hypothetical protein
VLSSVTLDDGTGTPVALHTDTPTSQAVLVTAQGLVGIGPLRSSKRVRPSAHGGIDETRFEEGRGPALVGEVMSQVNIEDCLAVFRDLTRPMLETLDNGPALLKWTEGAGLLNPILNPSFEYDPAGPPPHSWVATNTYRIDSGAVLEARKPGGIQTEGRKGYCSVVTSGVTSVEGIDTESVIPMVAGVPITVYVSVFSAEGTKELQLRLGASATGLTTLPITATAAFTRFSITLTPTGTGLGGFAVMTKGTAAAKFYIAAVCVGAPYFDGDSSGAEWKGEPGESVSSSGKNLRMLVRLDSDCEPILSGGAAHLNYQASFFAEDPRAYSQSLITQTGATLTGGASLSNEYVKPAQETYGLATDSKYIYWANATTHCIGRCELSGAKVENEWIKTGAAEGPIGVAVDAEHVFWTSASKSPITAHVGRATIAGGTVENSWFTATGIGSGGLAIDIDATYIYWSSSEGSSGVINRINKSTKVANLKWITGTHVFVEGLAVNASFIYWAEPFGATGFIARATIAGAEVNLKWIGTSPEPVGLTLTGTHLYWTSGGSIFSSTLSGSEIKATYAGVHAANSGLTTEGEWLYFTRLFSTPATIGQANIGGIPSGSNLIVAQPGNRPTPLTIKIHGAITNPLVVRVSDGAMIAFSGTVTAGNYLEVNAADRSVLLNGLTNSLGLLLPALTNWTAFQAPPSPTTQEYLLTGSAATTAYLEILSRAAYA